MGRNRKYHTNEEAAEANRKRAAEKSREKSEDLKEIGPLPKVVNPSRKAGCKKSLLNFMMTYGGTPEAEALFTFINPFCDEQRYLIQRIEDVLMHGGEAPLCIFRGGVKTTICEWGILWASLYGYQRFCFIVAASQNAARKIIANIKDNIKNNPVMAEDFPEVCYPIARLENANQRAATQKLNGEFTEIKFTADSLTLPKVAGAKSSHAIIAGVGADASFRGIRIGTQRPTSVLIDDPQTNKSAKSVKQTEDRWDNIVSSMKGLAGPGVSLAMIATVTVIRKGDLAEKILAKWGGKRFGMLRSMPSNMDAWEDYNEELERLKITVEDESERSRIMNEYYILNRKKLDEGAEAAWESNHTSMEVSAIQHAMNLYYFDKKAFWSEYMNQPLEDEKDAENLTREALKAKIRKEVPKGIVPLESTKITAAIDIQKTCLYWLVTAWDDTFSGHIVDYGRYPKGGKTMNQIHPNLAWEEQATLCLSELGNFLQNATYRREISGEALTIDKVIVDDNWGILYEPVKKICRSFPPKFMEPVRGWGKGPNSRFLAKRKVPGEERGPEWHKMPLEVKGICRHITYNTNFWKSSVRNRIQTGLHARSTLTFYAGDELTHKNLFRHLLGETSSKLTGEYGTIDQWKLTPGEPNHWLDCLVMSAVGASVLKIKLPDLQKSSASQSANTPKKVVKWCG